MIKISEELFKEYVDNGCVVALTYKNEQYEIFQMYSYDELGEKEYEGLFINDDKVRNIDAVIKKLKIKDEVEVDCIDEYEDYDAFLRNYQLKNITMDKLIENYSEANKFSLIMYCDSEHTYNKEMLDKAYEYVVSENKKVLEEFYNKQDLKEPFQTVYDNIKEECLNFRKEYEEVYGDKFQNSLICDQVGDDTKYYKPYQFFWNFYQTLGMELDMKENQIKVEGESFDINSVLPDELKKNLISYEMAYYSYSTYGPLQMIFYFNLNDETKEWLKQFENDFKLETLEDLAFYKNDERIFMSVTHEDSHRDLR